MPDIELKCSCGDPLCHQEVVIRKGAVFEGGDAPVHWEQGYINIYGASQGDTPEIMLNPEEMVKLRDWLNENYPKKPNKKKPVKKKYNYCGCWWCT